MWLPDGRYNKEPVTESEIEKDRFTWAIIREGVQVGLFSTNDEEVDRVISSSEIDSPIFQKYHEVGIQVDSGPLIEDRSAPYGLGQDPEYRKEMVRTLKTRRPSRVFVEAYHTYYQPRDDAERLLETLPAADYDTLVSYIQGGAEQDPINGL
ncbi:MAG: hypothetical protein ACRDTX_15210 [Pseudonocardiaceae bacterium]